MAKVPTITEINLNTGSRSLFSVGDTWSLQIRGAMPNAPVTWNGTLSGIVKAAQRFEGMTDASGNFTLQGIAGPAQVGQWVETWFVGGVPVGNINVLFVPRVPVGIPPVLEWMVSL